MRILNPPSQTQDSHHLRLSCLVHIRGETGQWVGHFHGRAHSAARTLWKKRQHQQLKDSFQSPHPSAPPFSSSSAHLEVSLYRKLNLMETFPRLIPFRHSHSPPAEHWHLKGKECSSCMSSAAPVPIILRECFIHIDGYIYTHIILVRLGIPAAPHFPQVQQSSFYNQDCPSSMIIFILLSTNSLQTWSFWGFFQFSIQRPFQHHKNPLTASEVN